LIFDFAGGREKKMVDYGNVENDHYFHYSDDKKKYLSLKWDKSNNVYYLE
jgi:hypothetical protein